MPGFSELLQRTRQPEAASWQQKPSHDHARRGDGLSTIWRITLAASGSLLLSGPKERDQPQDRDVDPDKRHHQPERAVPLHESRRASLSRPLDESKIEREVERA